MPLEQPKVIVASIVILEDHWIIKAPSLAAEALSTWVDLKDRNGIMTTAGELIRNRPVRTRTIRSARKRQGRS
jgi:hypothetical protein